MHADNAEGTTRAKELLERTGAQDLSATGASGADNVGGERPLARPKWGGVAGQERRVHCAMR